MAGAMRKMAVYLGLVEDDGYDGRGFDPDDDFEPELDPEPERDRRRHEPPHQSHQAHSSQRDEPVRVVQPSAPRDPVPHSASPRICTVMARRTRTTSKQLERFPIRLRNRRC